MTDDPMPSDTVVPPLQVAAEAFRAIEQRRWGDLARLFDPADVQQFRDGQIRRWAQPGQPYTITAEQIRRENPEMPRAVAEYQAEQFRAQERESTSRISIEFAGVDSPAQLASLSGLELLTRYLAAHSPEARFEAAIAAHERAFSSQVSREAMPSRAILGPRYEVIGSAAEGDSITHVLYRMLIGPAPADAADEEQMQTPPDVATLKRTSGAWRLKLPQNLFGLEDWFVSVAPDESNED